MNAIHGENNMQGSTCRKSEDERRGGAKRRKETKTREKTGGGEGWDFRITFPGYEPGTQSIRCRQVQLRRYSGAELLVVHRRSCLSLACKGRKRHVRQSLSKHMVQERCRVCSQTWRDTKHVGLHEAKRLVKVQ